MRIYKDSDSKPRLVVLAEKRIQDAIYRSDEAKIKNAFGVKAKATSSEILNPISQSRNDHQSNEMTAVPNPVPDTGFRSLVPLSAHTTSMSILPVSSLSALPPLLSLTSTTYGPSITTSASIASLPGPNRPEDVTADARQHTPQAHKLSTAIITLLAVGAGCLLVGVLIVIKICSRPTRRPRPTPSLPILDDPFADDSRFISKESPIFGGKERLSPRPGSNIGLYAWTQYPQSGLAQARPVPSPDHGKTSHCNDMYGSVIVAPSVPPQGRVSYTGTNRSQYLFAGHAHSLGGPTQTPVSSPYQPSVHPVKTAFARVVNRLSAASASLYPDSPRSPRSPRGDFVGAGTAFTGDDHHALKRSKSKNTSERTRNNSAENATIEYKNRLRYSQATAYDGADVSSPSFAVHVQPLAMPTAVSAPSATGGRTRIKSSYYAPGSYPRVSTLPPTSATHLNPFGTPHIPSIKKSESHRDRDTQALTNALGLASPTIEYAPSSPQPTLYPDDSLSIVGSRRQSKHSRDRLSDGRPSLPMMTSTLDTSALGSLMLMDFGMPNKPLQTIEKPQLDPTSVMVPKSALTNASASKSVASKKVHRPRNDDSKPPRVPSPPPMPSLTQMALEHSNPEAYADYRSPTYSMYGLYEAERKSRTGSWVY